VPRTTLHLDDEAMSAAKAYAARHDLTLGQAVSELVRLGIDRPLVTDERSGLRVARLSRRSARATSALVNALRDDQP
jgi:hypothetical protein